MTAHDKAKSTILEFVALWFEQDEKRMAENIQDYDGVCAEDVELWFWESGGVI